MILKIALKRINQPIYKNDKGKKTEILRKKNGDA
jgi:hypothetical protein